MFLKHALVKEFNPVGTSYPVQIPLQELIEAQVAKTPEALAVTYGEMSLTYAELNTLANQLAWELYKYGAGPNHVVGLCTERSSDMMVALLAILKSGGRICPSIRVCLPTE